LLLRETTRAKQKAREREKRGGKIQRGKITPLLLVARKTERVWETERRSRVSAPSLADFGPPGCRSDYRRRDLKDRRACTLPEGGSGRTRTRVELASNSFESVSSRLLAIDRHPIELINSAVVDAAGSMNERFVVANESQIECHDMDEESRSPERTLLRRTSLPSISAEFPPPFSHRSIRVRLVLSRYDSAFPSCISSICTCTGSSACLMVYFGGATSCGLDLPILSGVENYLVEKILPIYTYIYSRALRIVAKTLRSGRGSFVT